MDSSDRLESRLTTIVQPEVLGRGIDHRMVMGVYPHCLAEDVTSHILPVPGRKRFVVEAIPSTDAARLTIERALDWESAHRGLGDLEGSAWTFFRGAAYSFVADGEVVWEVCPRVGGGIALVYVQPASLRHRRRYSFQVAGNGNVISIPKDRLVRVACKESIALRRVHQMLAGPGLELPRLASLTDGKTDVKETLAYEKLALAKVSSLCGWHGGTFFADSVPEFYYVARIIRFFRVAARLRNAILEGINSALQRTGTGAQMALKGLQDAEALDGLEKDLLAGRRSVKETTDLLFSTS